AAAAVHGLGDAVAVAIDAHAERRAVFRQLAFVPTQLDESAERRPQLLLIAGADDTGCRDDRLHPDAEQERDEADDDDDKADGEDPQMIGTTRRDGGGGHNADT